MKPILAGVETEYGLLIDGRGADSQVEDSQALVRSYPDECFLGWDYRTESPRADLRGFKLEQLAFDPEDAKFDQGKSYGTSAEIRSDRILPNGARFYNDHGHPEYATPECWSIFDLALRDFQGQDVVLQAALAYEEKIETRVRIYKNNTDFHGASYGTHEGYLVPRALGFQTLYDTVSPMLIVRQILTGAGKVGSESGPACNYQISQRADFFVEPYNAETLYRRPIFNTRDEPHADHSKWIRLHVISGDANMISTGTALKVGLVKLAVQLAIEGTAPIWRISDPVKAFQNISRDERYEFRIELQNRSWTNAYEVFESYFAAAEATLELDDEMTWVIATSRTLLADLKGNFAAFRRRVDWAAKRFVLEQYMEGEGTDWRDPALRSYDLEYHNVDLEEGLHEALVQMGEVEPNPAEKPTQRLSRAFARGLAVQKFASHLITASWRSLTFGIEGDQLEVPLPPDVEYPAKLAEINDVGTFISMLRGIQ